MSEQPAALPERDSRLRSLAKALSWRVVATTTTTAVIAFFVTGRLETALLIGSVTALLIGSVEFVMKFVIFYGHEKAWQLMPRLSSRLLRLNVQTGA
jgi:uncharacterized membrane protein